MLAGSLIFQLFRDSEPSVSRPAVNTDIALQAIPLFDLDGNKMVVGDWKGKFLVINFWAPWCAPCRREIPALVRFQKAYEDKNVQVIGLAFDGLEPVRRFAADYQINYPLFLAENRIAMYSAAFGNSSGSLPFTVVLDGEQNIVFQHNGELSFEQLKQQVENPA